MICLLVDFHLKALCPQNSFPANGDVDKFRHCINNYNITFDCCLKNIDVAVGGVCNEWCDKWWKYHFWGVSTEKRIHNKNIFFGFKHLTTIYYFKWKNLWTIFDFSLLDFVLYFNQIVWRQYVNKRQNYISDTIWKMINIVHNLLPQFEVIPNSPGIGVIPTKSYTMLTSY